jgi:hypothetical protein
MIKNRDLFLTDPTINTIPNDGVTTVVVPQTEEQWNVLRYELASFVCDGEYRRGLERILSTYLSQLSQPKQSAVWVSGFYGSGKSHFVRVLEYLWRDITFPDGVSARGLVRLPEDIRELLVELSTIGRREGGLWSAAGTLTAGVGSVRLALLGMLFRSAELPEQYALARFVLWLKRMQLYDAILANLHQAGTSLNTELEDFYVSVPLAQSLIDIGALPQKDPAEVQNLLIAQYPPDRDEISDDEFLRSLEDVFAFKSNTPGKLPYTLIVFDELQQFINEDPQRTLYVQNIVEACTSRFGSRLLFVGTGQAALQATSQLSKLQGRFTIRVTLSDTDVERVVREVVLRKKPTQEPIIRELLNSVSGEIDRHLASTRIGAHPSDASDIIADYPLLPVRRRFWERVLRAIDSAGTSGQLRTQLRIIHEAARAVASAPLGTVVAADFIYDQQKTHMLQSSELPREIAAAIAEQENGTDEGHLRSRLCALVFLIGKLPSDGVSATGVRATAQNLADLLVEDLIQGSASLRQRVPIALQQLVEAGTVMQVDDEYRLQTAESKDWEAEYRRRFASIFDNDSRIISDRTTELRAAVTSLRKGLTLTQGVSKTPRKFDFYFGLDRPPVNTDVVPVWVRDEWTVSERTVREEAQSVGTESPIVFVFLPRRDADQLKRTLANYAAAREILAARPAPSTPEGLEARGAIVSRADIERRRLDLLITGIVERGTILKGGGSDVNERTLQDSLRAAIESALVRLFPHFGMVDHPSWGLVVSRAGNGAVDALAAVGYQGDATQYPACREVRAFLGSVGKKGSEVRRRFTGAGYGWPQDAIDGVLLVLVAAGHVRAVRNGQTQRATEITRAQIGQTDFISEGVTVTTGQRIAVRKLITDIGLPVKNGDEGSVIPLMLQSLIDLAADAGGEPPRPVRPVVTLIEQLRLLGGNEQLAAVYERRDELLALFQVWRQAREQIRQRLSSWEQLQRLLRHVGRLPIAVITSPQVTAVSTNRALLAEPNPVPPLLAQLANAARIALQDARQRLYLAREQAIGELEATEEWQRLPNHERERIIRNYTLSPIAELHIGTDGELLSALDATPLADWEDKIVALSGRVAQAREEAAKLLEPKAVVLQFPRRTLKTSADVEAYLDQLRSAILEQIEVGKPVIV